MYDSIEKTYLYNPFDVKLWSDEMIEKQVRQLLPRYKHDDDTMYGMASNVETLANIMYLFGEMIARLTKDYGLSKIDCDAKEKKAHGCGKNHFEKFFHCLLFCFTLQR